MLVDSFDDIWVGVEALTVVLPEVPRGQQEAAMLRQQVAQLLQAGQEVCHLQANFLHASDPRTERQAQATSSHMWSSMGNSLCPKHKAV